ncbi:SH3 domain-containing protein [Kyrpidia spormannii]|uniref:SH3b domain-containing protein n=1 Tax=Kyrpidia spormannii TaxID=2055160 RepID=A0A6F9E3P9_9BACL|nr:SH3 domain-containing protein [Kyrpidia spormannii]CAB3391125.1 conserved exported protein of unknown function [Kyrpidia spormannii]
MKRKRYLWPLLVLGTAGGVAGAHPAHAEGSYAVFQYAVRLKEFPTLTDAVAYAKLWDHSRIVNLATGEDEWDNYPAPIAKLGYWVVRRGEWVDAAWTQEQAVQKAKNVPDSVVLNALTGTVVWRHPPTTSPSQGGASGDGLSSRGETASNPTSGNSPSTPVDHPPVYAQVLPPAATATKAPANPLSGGSSPGPAPGTSTESPSPASSAKGQGTSSPGAATSSPQPGNGSGTTRVPDRPAPYGPDYYEVQGGTLLHLFGTPGAPPKAAIVVGPAPDFMRPGDIYIRDSAHRFYRRTPSGDQPVGVWEPPFETLDLRLPAKITGQEIDQFIREHHPESPLVGMGNAFVQAGQQYGVNPQYLAAHAILESGWGLSSIALDKKNLFGYGAYDGDPYNAAATFASYQDSIRFIAYFVRHQYLDSSGRWYGGSPTLDGMNVHYATDPDWAEKIASLMEQMRPYQPEDYRGVAVLPASAPQPPGPIADPPPAPANSGGTLPTPNSGQPGPGSGFPIPGSQLGDRSGVPTPLPAGLKGETTDAVNLREGPSTSTRVITVLPPATSVTVLQRSPDGWFQVDIGGQKGWVYGQYLQLDHVLVARVDDALNVRRGPGLSFSVITQVPAGTLLTPVNNAGGKPTVVNNWYHVRLPSGQEGWVYGDYVAQAVPV